MKKIALAVVASLAFAMPSVYAQSVDPAAAAAVKEMLVAMKYRDVVVQSMQHMGQNMPAMMMQGASAAINSNPKLSAEQKKAALAKAEREIPQAAAAFAGTFNDPKLIDEMMAETIPLYARHFTAAEIKEMAAFYKTPVGAKMLATMPQIMNESMMISQRVMMPRVRAAIQKLAQAEAK